MQDDLHQDLIGFQLTELFSLDFEQIEIAAPTWHGSAARRP
jgi:hypothetical protein